MKRVVYHRLAAKELINSARFYERSRELLGEAFLSEVDAVAAEIQARPTLGKCGMQGTLSRRTKRFPFRVIYLLQPDRIWIIAVAHLSRRPGYWARRVA